MTQPTAPQRSPFVTAQRMALPALAAVVLLSGLAVYLVDRPAGHAMWIPAVGSPVSPRLLGTAGDWLPSFLHALAFGLMTAAVLRGGSRWRYAGCAAWALIDVAFEVVQHAQLKAPFVAALRGSGTPGELAEPLARYLLRGTFDAADVVAVLAGSLCAAAVLRLPSNRHPGTESEWR